MTPAQHKQLAAILYHADVRQITFDSSTAWSHVRVTYVIGGIWFNESIEQDGSLSGRILSREEDR